MYFSFLFLGFLMDVFQTPFLPELSLDESEDQFEVFCRKRGMYPFFFFKSYVLYFTPMLLAYSYHCSL